MSANDSFNPSPLICSGDGKISGTLNPGEYSDITVCYRLRSGTHIVGVKGVGMFDDKQNFYMKLDEVLTAKP